MSRTSHTLDCGCRACVNEWIDLADDLEAKNKELEAALKTVQQYWGRINEKGLVATIKDLEAENKELVAFVRYVSEIDPREVSDPDNENPLSMGELQWGAKELLKQEGGENHG